MLHNTMSTVRIALFAALTIACWSSMATAQFAKFVDETSERSVVASNLFATDIEEKDYAWGDVDQDGDTDLVVVRKVPFTNPGGRPNVLFMNEGTDDGQACDGVLVDRTSLYAPAFLDLTNDRDVVLADVDGDGWLDIVTAPTYSAGQPTTISHPRVYVNQGEVAGVWQGFVYEPARIPLLPVTPNFCAVAAGDVTGNGRPDLYFVDYGDLEDRLLINDGNGFFTDESLLRMTSTMLHSDFGTSGVIVDMNGDGTNDVVKDMALAVLTRISYNNPANEGFFNATEIVYQGSGYFVSAADLNSDGMMDLIITDDGADRYLLNQGNGGDGMANFISFVFPASTNGFGGNSVAADLNNDGWNDVIITDVDVDIPGCTRFTNILRNNANPPIVTFTDVLEMTNIPQSQLQGVHDVAIIDLNGDGWLDLVLGRCSSSEIWIQHPYGIVFDFPQGLPSIVTPDEPFTIQAQLTPVGGTLAPDTATLHYAINYGRFTSVLMTDLGGNLYEVDLPATACLDGINFYFSAETVEENVYSTDPLDAPANTYRADAATGLEITHLYNFEAGEDLTDWAITSDPSLITGEWEQADPNGTYWFGQAAPEDDATPGEDNVMAFVTDNGPPGGGVNANDVDGGPTYLISPPFDVQDTNAMISYARWFFTIGGTPDALTTEVSNDGSSWVLVEMIDGTDGEWQVAEFLVSDFVEPSQIVQVRFSTVDADSSITEAGIDDFQVEQFTCGPACLGDLDGDGSVGASDLLTLLASWGPCKGCPADFDENGNVGASDLLALLANWGPCP